jgi:tetratricopeptide (TPR) repeat protein
MKRYRVGVLLFLGSIHFLLSVLLSRVSAEDSVNTEAVQGQPGVEAARAAGQMLMRDSSAALVNKAWEALENNDLEAVLDLTNACIDRYDTAAQQMQSTLDEAPGSQDTEQQVHARWALNDVATALFIKGKVFQNAKMFDEAKIAYQKLIDEYSGGQCWDPAGWFWKPAEAAQENLTMLETGVFYDFGDYKSSTLVAKAWEALEKEDFHLVLGYADKCIKLYEKRAREMQAGLTDYPQGSPEQIFGYWALNDVATAHFIKAKALMAVGSNEQAIDEFEVVRDEYSYGQCWDPRGWFWKPVTEANNWLNVLTEEKERGF